MRYHKYRHEIQWWTDFALLGSIFFCLAYFILLGAPQEIEKSFAQDNNSPKKNIVILSFSASWCQPCQIMKQQVWANKEVKKFLKENEIEKFDIDTDRNQKYTRAYEVTAIPCVVIVERTAENKAREINRFVGIKSTKATIKFIEDTIKGESGYCKLETRGFLKILNE